MQLLCRLDGVTLEMLCRTYALWRRHDGATGYPALTTVLAKLARDCGWRRRPVSGWRRRRLTGTRKRAGSSARTGEDLGVFVVRVAPRTAVAGTGKREDYANRDTESRPRSLTGLATLVACCRWSGPASTSSSSDRPAGGSSPTPRTCPRGVALGGGRIAGLSSGHGRYKLVNEPTYLPGKVDRHRGQRTELALRRQLDHRS